MVKNPPAMQKTWVQSLCWEDPLEKEMATHSSILAEEFRKQRSLVGYGVHEAAKVSDTIVTKKQEVTISIAFTLY